MHAFLWWATLCCRLKLWCNSSEVRKSHFLCMFSQWLVCQIWNCLKVRSEIYWDWSWTPSLCLSVWLYILITFLFEDWCATSVISSLFVYFALLLLYYIKIMVLINSVISTLIRLFTQGDLSDVSSHSSLDKSCQSQCSRRDPCRNVEAQIASQMDW